MKEFFVRLQSVRDVDQFVAMVTKYRFPVELTDGTHTADGNSILELFCLDLSKPVKVSAQCTDSELEILIRDAGNMLAN